MKLKRSLTGDTKVAPRRVVTCRPQALKTEGVSQENPETRDLMRRLQVAGPLTRAQKEKVKESRGHLLPASKDLILGRTNFVLPT